MNSIIQEKFDDASLEAIWKGRLRIDFDAARQAPWWGAWEFSHGGSTWHVPLAGVPTVSLEPGEAVPFTSASGPLVNFTRFLLSIDHSSPESVVTGVAMLTSDISFGVALDNMPAQRVSFLLTPEVNGSNPAPESVRRLFAALRIERDNRYLSFREVMAEILRQGLVLTDNRRLPFRRNFDFAEVAAPVSLRSGEHLSAELFRLKNGGSEERARYMDIEGKFFYLTGRRLGLRMTQSTVDPALPMAIEPTVVDEKGEIPVEFSGAGIQEALMLSTLLAGRPGRLFVLDEPTVHLEPTMQRRLISLLRKSGQCLAITHSPDLVPIESADDIKGIVRLGPHADGPELHRADSLDDARIARWIQLLEPTHVRALLFAAAVILCEGRTEVDALSQWWRNTDDLGAPNPEASNMVLISVEGDTAFGAYIDYLDAFGVPWAIIADGPAAAPTRRESSRRICGGSTRPFSTRPLVCSAGAASPASAHTSPAPAPGLWR
ncbi:AAA family ATPase [Streptosporangiaceae bacterium NEAU-GS5]|nr:AAA family ATPase [Streptosporangiaceae bacterium NEAU-GS5]